MVSKLPISKHLLKDKSENVLIDMINFGILSKMEKQTKKTSEDMKG
jgi:hypothetical protein